ncbi:MAG: hypothetical protein WA584_08500 [Pyrinomonadaceae bacterium]
MEKHLKSKYSTHCTFKISKIVNHDYESLPIIAPKLNADLRALYNKEKKRNYTIPRREYYFSIDKKNNKLLASMLKVLRHLKREGVNISEENIKSRLPKKITKTSNRNFWLILRIAIYELGYMND